MKKTKISKYLIFISIFTLITVFVLMLQKSYSNLVTPIKEVEIDDTSEDIDPNLDLTVIEEMKNRQTIDTSSLPESETSTSDILLTEPTPTIVAPTLVATSSAVITPVPTLIP